MRQYNLRKPTKRHLTPPAFFICCQTITEKLAAENRSIRGELERLLATRTTPSPVHTTRDTIDRINAWGSVKRSSGSGVGVGSVSGDGLGNTSASVGASWDGTLHAQVSSTCDKPGRMDN